MLTKRMLSIIDGVVTAVSVKTHYAYGELIACISKEKKIVDKMIRSSVLPMNMTLPIQQRKLKMK